LWLAASGAYSQTYDTICNWDNINREWSASTPGAATVQNPAPDDVNDSWHCYKFITGTGEYDYMYTMLDEAVNFEINPRYKLKVLAPESGGNITLKFENYNNTASQEIVLTAVPGQWTDLEYDFTGLPYNDYVRLVIFPDFEGTEPGNAWYIDDVLREQGEDPGTLELDSNLPIVVINTNGQIIADDPKIIAHMGVIDNGPGERNNLEDPFTNYDGDIAIEIRGQSSQMFPKNSFAVETRDSVGENLNVALLGLPEENDWVFYAPYSDKSLLRNVVSFEMGRKMGNYCSRSVFFELVINDDYKGIYTLMEKIKRDDNRVDIAKLEPTEITGDEMTGGYIFKVDKIDPDYQNNVDGFTTYPTPPYPDGMNITFQYFSPGPDELASQQRNYLRGRISAAENSLTAYFFSNPYLGYQQYFDVLSFIDFMLLSEIPKEVDKYRYSTYFYKEKDSDGGKIFAGPPWDFDLGYGNVDYWPPGLDRTGFLYEMVEPVGWGIMFWWKRMMEDPYFRDLARTRWNWLRENGLGDNDIHTMIDSILVHTTEARIRNFQRWPIIGQYVWPNYDWYQNTYADDVDYVEDFLFDRVAWIDNNLSGSVISPAAGISAETGKINLRLYNEYFCRPDLKKSWFLLNDAPGSITVDSAVYINPSECQLLLSGDVSGITQVSVTISEKAINYWLDITSSTLSSAGTGDPEPEGPKITVFEENHRLHIRCDKPELIDGPCEIVNIAGQRLGQFMLQQKTENIVSHNLKPGMYLLAVKSNGLPLVLKFVVARY
jgi:hypothetical protein